MKTSKTKTKTNSNSKKTSLIETTGKANASAYFERSGIRYGDKLNHNPFLVFEEDSKNINVKIVNTISDLVKYPSRSKVMAQWPGKQKSDFFKFTVGDLRKHIRENPRHTCQKV